MTTIQGVAFGVRRRTNGMAAVTVVLAVGACSSASQPTPAPFVDIYRPSEDARFAYYQSRVARDSKMRSRTPNEVWSDYVRDKIALNVANGPCPKVGEKAVAGPNQVAGTMANTLGGAAWGNGYYLLPLTAGKITQSDNYLGSNAFGVTRTVERFTREYPALAVKAEPASVTSDVLQYAKTSSRLAASAVSGDPQAKRMEAAFGSGLSLWVAGDPIAGPTEHRTGALPTINMPIDATLKYKANQAIELQCAAMIDKSGVVVQRLY